MASLYCSLSYFTDMKAFFTGHRILNPSYRDNYRHNIKRLIELARLRKIKHFYCGMARGADLLVATVLNELGLDWTAVIPCPEQSKLWNHEEREQYANLVKAAPDLIVLYKEYKPGVMQARNTWMVKRSDLCLAFYDGRNSGGTALTVCMALSCNLPILSFNPLTFEIVEHPPEYKQLSLF